MTLVNTAPEEVQGTLSLYENDGRLVMSASIRLPAFSGFSGTVDELAALGSGFEGYAVVDSADGPAVGPETLIGFESYRNLSRYALIRAFPESSKLRRGYLPHFSSRAGYSTTLTLVNISSETQVLRITAEALQADGIARTPSSATVERTILPGARLEESAEQMFNFGGEALITGYIRFETVGDTSGVVGFLDYGTADGPVLSALEARAEGSSDILLSPVAEGSDYWTALALLNLRP